METTNPYTTPQGELMDGSEEYGTINILLARGRIGRLRYIGYSMGIGLALYLVVALVTLAISFVAPESVLRNVLGIVLALVMFVGGIIALAINVLLTIQRCHDFNASGWLSLLLLLPFVPIIFWFVPGTQGANDYGLQPPPNRGGILVIIVVFAAVVILAILAAIAIPAYQDYLTRAQGM